MTSRVIAQLHAKQGHDFFYHYQHIVTHPCGNLHIVMYNYILHITGFVRTVNCSTDIRGILHQLAQVTAKNLLYTNKGPLTSVTLRLAYIILVSNGDLAMIRPLVFVTYIKEI